MIHQEGTFKGIRNASVYYQSWLPKEEPRGSLLIIHGLADHCGRYGNFVNHFVPRGYAVYGIDHPGHGKSDGKRVFIKRFGDFIENLNTYLEMILTWQPGKPVFLYGHSMGGLIGSIFLLENQEKITGAILSGPGVKVPENISSGVILAGKVFSILMPGFGLIGLDASHVSRDPAVVQAYIDDPLVFSGKTTARLAAELLKAMQRVSSESEKITLPILILHGGDDKLVDPASAQMLYDKVTSQNKTLKIYDHLYHEIINEPERDTVLADMEKWLETHLPS
jgi:acylglycerol lipase